MNQPITGQNYMVNLMVNFNQVQKRPDLNGRQNLLTTALMEIYLANDRCAFKCLLNYYIEIYAPTWHLKTRCSFKKSTKFSNFLWRRFKPVPFWNSIAERRILSAITISRVSIN